MLNKKSYNKAAALLLVLVMVFLPVMDNPVFSQINIVDLELSMGGSRIIAVDSIKKIKLMNPMVADVTPLNDCEIMVNGLAVGKTELLVFTEMGRRQFMIEVTEESGAFTEKAERLLKVKNISSEIDDGIVYLNGVVSSAEMKDAVMKLAQNHYKGMRDIMNMIEVAEPVTALNMRTDQFGAYSAGPGLESRIALEPGAEAVEVEIMDDTIILNGCVLDQTVVPRLEKLIRVYGRPGLRIKNLIKVEQKVFSFRNTVRKAINMPGVKIRLFYMGGLLPEDQRLIDAEKVTVVLEGKVKNDVRKKKAEEIAKAFAPKVLNHLTISEPQQVLIEAKFVEVSKNLTKKFGFSWGALQANGSGYEDSIQTGVIHFAENAGIDQRGDQVVTGAQVTENFNPFHFANLNRLETLGIQIQADESRDNFKVLSSPRILTLSDTQATLKVGGQVPITTIGQDGNPVTEWKDYGINLEILPQVDEYGKVKAKIHTEVSDLDYANSDRQGNPAVKSKAADTVVYVHDRDTIVISGLITNNKSRIKKGVPYLMDIPVLGRLFQSKQWINSQSELLIFLTPKLINSKDRDIINPNIKQDMADQVITQDSSIIDTGKRIYKMGQNQPVGVTGDRKIKADVKYLDEKSNANDFSYIDNHKSRVAPVQYAPQKSSEKIVIKADRVFNIPANEKEVKVLGKTGLSKSQPINKDARQSLMERIRAYREKKAREQKAIEQQSIEQQAAVKKAPEQKILAKQNVTNKAPEKKPQEKSDLIKTDSDLKRQLEIQSIFKEITEIPDKGL